jgi:hypothetical protein
MSPERPESPAADRGRVRWFALALALFAAWTIGLGLMAFTSSQRPRAVEATPPRP